MRSFFFALASLGIACARQIPLRPSATSIEPCAQVSAASASYLAATPTATAAIVDGQLFHECLQSIPVDTHAAIDLLRSLEPYIELQSTLAYLAHPPADYPHPAVDILASLQGLIGKVTAGEYSGEYEFQTDLYRLFLSARDGHFSFIPDLLGVGTFRIPEAALVSISRDGHQLPQVYMRSDVLETKPDGFALKGDMGRGRFPSHVVSVNDIPISDYMSARTAKLPFHDPDAAYNFLFSEISQIVQFGEAGDGAFVTPVFYPGPETVIQFANGSEIRVHTVTEINTSFDHVTDGKSAYKRFCVREEPEWGKSQPLPSDTLPTIIPFYPQPLVKDAGNHIAGYFLDNDTAVLSILNFDAQSDPTGFQATVAVFLEKCKVEGKTKLIIDVFANGGGIVELGLDLFVQLFPNIEPASYANMRASPVLDALGQGMSELNTTSTGDPFDGDPFNVHSSLTTNRLPWTNWSEMYGPVSPDGSSDAPQSSLFTFTRIFQPDCDLSAPPRFQITRGNSSAAPIFAPENIVLLTDGYCASTCAIFAEILKTQTQSRVRSVVVGGRPRSESYHKNAKQSGELDEDEDEDGDEDKARQRIQPRPAPMQALGTTKGRAFWSFSAILATAQTVAQGGGDVAPELELEDSRKKMAQLASRFSDLPLRRTFRPDAAGVNGMNHIRVGNGNGNGSAKEEEEEEEAIPLQFVHEDADVRMFFSLEMMTSQEKVWENVARLVFA